MGLTQLKLAPVSSNQFHVVVHVLVYKGMAAWKRVLTVWFTPNHDPRLLRI
jgi:hypothetical protein